MKILFLNQFFWPDSSATSQHLTDLAAGLVERGDEVCVICTQGGYALTASGEAPPVQVYRVNALPFVRGRIGRMLSYLSFYASAAFRGLTLPRCDLVVSLTTPPLISLLGTVIQKLRGSRHIIWEQDVYPDVAIDLKYFKAHGVIDRITGYLADYSRRHADGIIALGECMKQRLIGRGVPAAGISIAENWADADAIRPRLRPGDPNTLVLLYSGNLGLAHDIDTIAGAILKLRHDKRFRFVFAGSGGRREELASRIAREGVDSVVELRPYVSRENLSESLATGDIGLVTQSDVCCGSIVPSKIYGILAAGRPLLFIGPRAATPALTIERFGCGWQVDCGDVDSLTRLLLRLVDDPGEVHAAGRRARQALVEHYDMRIGIARIAEILKGETSTFAPSARTAFPPDAEVFSDINQHTGDGVCTR